MKNKYLKILFIVLLLYNIGCGKAQYINNLKTDSMKYFNTEPYEKLPKDTFTGYKISPNKDLISYGSYPNMHFIKIYKYNSPYVDYYQYYSNKVLEFSVSFFYGASIGIRKEYNEKGDLIKEIDQDKDYPFSIEDMIKKMKDDYNIDLLNKAMVFKFNRYLETNTLHLPLYEVWFENKVREGNYITYLFKGNTGELLVEDTRFLGDKKKSLLMLYLDSLERKKSSSSNYKIYKGKKYTQEEWEVYEQELWKKYAKKNNIPIDEKPNSSTGFLLDE